MVSLVEEEGSLVTNEKIDDLVWSLSAVAKKKRMSLRGEGHF